MAPLSVASAIGDAAYPLYPVCTSLAIILILLPAYWQFKGGNVGAISYIIWIALANLNALINSISWSKNLHEPPWIWCDISTAFSIGLNVALPTSSFLITRSLYRAGSTQSVITSDAESRRAKYSDVAVAVGTPMLGVALHVVVQGHRADIGENWGCWPTTQVTPVAFGLVFGPPILINLASVVYATLVFRIFWKQRKRIREFVSSPKTLDQYFRLMAIAATEIVCCLPASVYAVIANARSGVLPWISWSETHSNFNRINYIPYVWFISLEPWLQIGFFITRYSIPVAAFIFFIYFGMFGESGAFYRRQLRRLAAWLGFPARSAAGSNDPSFARPPPILPSERRNRPPSHTPRIALARTKETFSTESPESLVLEGAIFYPLSMPSCFYDVKDLESEMGYLLRPPPPVVLRFHVQP